MINIVYHPGLWGRGGKTPKTRPEEQKDKDSLLEGIEHLVEKGVVALPSQWNVKEIIWIIVLSIIPLFLATRLGGNIVRKIKQESFMKFVYILLILLGILIILK